MRFFEQIAVSKPLFYQNFFEYFDAYMIDYGGAYELGRVEVSFNIEVDGKLSDVKIRKSTYPEVDYFVVKMISEMPRWQPAMMFGQFVKVQYTMPVVFNSGYKKNAIRKEAKRKQ
jgi:TonB family protein